MTPHRVQSFALLLSSAFAHLAVSAQVLLEKVLVAAEALPIPVELAEAAAVQAASSAGSHEQWSVLQFAAPWTRVRPESQTIPVSLDEAS